jgi:hypothetical protein
MCFAGAVTANDACDFAFLDLEGDVFQGPKSIVTLRNGFRIYNFKFKDFRSTKTREFCRYLSMAALPHDLQILFLRLPGL